MTIPRSSRSLSVIEIDVDKVVSPGGSQIFVSVCVPIALRIVKTFSIRLPDASIKDD